MITDRNKLNFVTIQWLWFLCLILACSSGTWIHNVEATQQQQQQTLLQQQPQQMKSTLQQQQQEFESNGPPQHQQQQQQQQLQDVTVRNFSPRMDYNNNEWRPVGRGDPLKNDPTFDYSPPTLDRVRYWADPDKEKEKMEEVTAALVEAKLKKANPGKNEILLLGVTGDRERIRGAAPPVVPHVHQPSASVVKNAKGETPLLQPKYTSIRRSYYAHQIPTHLMPPPMQPAATQQLQSTSHMVKQPAHTEYQQQQQQQQQLQSGSHMVKQPAHTEYQPQQQQQMHSGAHMVKPAHTEYQQQMHSGSHMVKPVHTEYRHNMPAHSYMTSSPMSSMNMHSKPYYMSTATQSWLHNPSSSQPVSSSIHSGMMMSGNSQRYSQPHDSHHQESVNYFSYNTRPHMTSSTPSLMMMNGAGSHHDVYSPNSIRGSSGLHKSATSSRKPWIHDLLQKEFIKPVKPTMGPHTYHSENIKPLHTESHFEPMLGSQGTNTTYTPVTFVTPTMPTTTTPNTQAVYITSTTYQTTTPSTTTTTTNAPSSIYPSYSTQAPRTTSTFSPTRLLIPNTSNLSFRPTVAPMKMTTDSLFSHYNQPDKPLRGPMYLIIEGHSKVKTYGKDELDPHKPKIVPVIPKREPVLRIADPNEKRGTPETFQVKHLHTKTTPIMKTTTTTTTARTTTSTPRTTTTTTKTTTTKKPLMKTTTTKSTTTVKPTTNTKTTQKMVQKLGTTKTTTTTTTVKPLTTKMTPKLSVTTSSKPKVEKIPTNNEKISIKDSKSSNKGEKSTMDLKMSSKLNTNNPNSLETPQKKPSQTILNDPPTGMQGLMSFLDSSLGNMFKEDPLAATALEPEKKETTTKLKAIPMNTATQKSAPQTEARVSTKLEAIKAEDYHDDDDKFFKVTTEYLPRETRQIFDYDQLPESRINDNDNSNYDDLFEDDLSAFNFDTEYEEDDEEDQQGATVENQQNLIKRIDSLVSSSTEDDFDDSSAFDDVDLTDIGEDDLEALAESRQQHQSKKA